MAELDVTNVRELEDFLIYDCMYAVSALSLSVFVNKHDTDFASYLLSFRV